ncbi:ACT domain-containing protein [Alteribacter natronophilus]|uniref:ACT domain-containing protein n=1 Tax=Alteribacter natronophilus TaxID=2583810 RepID=UPI00110DFE03|nr:ACT domain-containing protein [Alteribacter natronophilus]TMW73984.1 ACT domain-containing protein [Alteribacter natronophilus]
MKRRTDQFYLVREDMLPEAMLKTVEAKKLLESGRVEKVSEAASEVDMSRSAFYKYKDGIFPFHTMVKEKIITLSIHLEDQSGALSRLLAIIAEEGGNVLTINQTIPLQGRATLTISIETAAMTTNINRLVQKVEALDPVERVEVIGSGT